MSLIKKLMTVFGTDSRNLASAETEMMLFIAKIKADNYQDGRQAGMEFIVNFVDSHPKISARLTDDGVQIVHHENEDFKKSFDWNTSPKTTVEREIDTTYH